MVPKQRKGQGGIWGAHPMEVQIRRIRSSQAAFSINFLSEWVHCFAGTLYVAFVFSINPCLVLAVGSQT